MRAYRVRQRDHGCCPGHDKFPTETYRSRRSKRAHAAVNRIAHKRARAWARAEIPQAVAVSAMYRCSCALGRDYGNASEEALASCRAVQVLPRLR